MKKLLYIVGMFFGLVFILSATKGGIQNACAKVYGVNDICPLNGARVGSIYSGGTSSVSISFNVTLVGTVPTGTKAWVQVGTDPKNTCGGELKCLTRYDEASISLNGGAKTYGPIKLEKIGCSDKGCRVGGVDKIEVSAYLADASGNVLPTSTTGCANAVISGSNVSGSPPMLDITNQNALSRDVNVTFTCPLPPAPLCVVPKPTVVITCPNGCQ